MGSYAPRTRIDLNKRYNDLAEKIVGRRLLQEKYPEPDSYLPGLRGIGEVFGGEYVFDGNVTWLKGSCSTPEELEAMLDRVDKMDIRDFILPKTGSPRRSGYSKNTAEAGIMAARPRSGHARDVDIRSREPDFPLLRRARAV